KAGVRATSMRLSLDGEALTDQSKLIDLVQAKGEKSIPLELVREGKKQTIEITPQRRKVRKVSSMQLDQPRTFRYEVIHPGAVLTEPLGINPGNSSAMSATQRGVSFLAHAVPESDQKPTQETPAGVSKRLDDLAAQVKVLRQ